jgi:hypothetical protein
MKKLLCLAAVLFAAGCRDSWVDFQSPEGPSGQFAVKMPAKPVMKPSHMGTVYVVTNGEMTYDVGVSSVPGPFGDPSTTERMFDEMQKSFIGGETAPTRQKQLKLGPEGYPGREVVVEKKTGIGLAVFTGRAYRVRGTLFTLTVRLPATKANDPSVQKFFDSFRVVKPPAA